MGINVKNVEAIVARNRDKGFSLEKVLWDLYFSVDRQAKEVLLSLIVDGSEVKGYRSLIEMYWGVKKTKDKEARVTNIELVNGELTIWATNN